MSEKNSFTPDRNQRRHSREQVRRRQQTLATGALVLAVTGVAVGLNHFTGNEVAHTANIEQEALKGVKTAANKVVALKAGVAYRSVPVMDDIEGAEPTLVDRVKEGDVLRIDRPVEKTVNNVLWYGFTTPNKSAPTDQASAQSMYWVNISELKPEQNYELFDYAPIGSKPNPASIEIHANANRNYEANPGSSERPNPVIAMASTVDANIFYDTMIATEQLEYVQANAQIATALKIESPNT